MPNRHVSRETALKAVYRWSFDEKVGFYDTKSLTRLWGNENFKDAENKDFFERVVNGVGPRLPELDELIKSSLENWRFDRIQKIELAILRLAIFELLFDIGGDKSDAPVIIDEALELTKTYATQDSVAFINGILDSVANTNGSDKK